MLRAFINTTIAVSTITASASQLTQSEFQYRFQSKLWVFYFYIMFAKLCFLMKLPARVIMSEYIRILYIISRVVSPLSQNLPLSSYIRS